MRLQNCNKAQARKQFRGNFVAPSERELSAKRTEGVHGWQSQCLQLGRDLHQLPPSRPLAVPPPSKREALAGHTQKQCGSNRMVVSALRMLPILQQLLHGLSRGGGSRTHGADPIKIQMPRTDATLHPSGASSLLKSWGGRPVPPTGAAPGGEASCGIPSGGAGAGPG